MDDRADLLEGIDRDTEQIWRLLPMGDPDDAVTVRSGLKSVDPQTVMPSISNLHSGKLAGQQCAFRDHQAVR